jgi:hypothetical protein
MFAKRLKARFFCFLISWGYVGICSGASSQTASAKSTGDQPSKQQTAEFIRGKLLSLAPHDGKHEYSDIDFNYCSMVLNFEGRKDYLAIHFSRLDGAALTWEVVGNSDQDKVLLLTLVSVGHNGLTKYTSNGVENPLTYPMAFSFAKAADIPDFQKRMTEAVKHIISLCKAEYH